MFLVQMVQALVGIEFGNAEDEVECRQSSKIRARKFVQRVEEQPVGDQACINTSRKYPKIELDRPTDPFHG